MKFKILPPGELSKFSSVLSFLFLRGFSHFSENSNIVGMASFFNQVPPNLVLSKLSAVKCFEQMFVWSVTLKFFLRNLFSHTFLLASSLGNLMKEKNQCNMFHTMQNIKLFQSIRK